MYFRDTIVAISTPPGNGGIGIIRISGDRAALIGESVFKPVRKGGLKSHLFCFGTIRHPESDGLVDEAMAVFMRSPRSYTREDVLELHCHGGWLLVERVLSLVLASGARLADPGEFTRRAFLNGRIDLAQAEAVMDIIASNTDASLQLAQNQREGLLSRKLDEIRSHILNALALVEAYIDFPEDALGDADLGRIRNNAESALSGIAALLDSYNEGKILRDGISALIIGKPNVGKSSLLNQLLNENRAIVTHVPGTTRDIIEETVNINGLAVRLLDTAGVRHTDDLVEKEGISRTLENIPLADLVLFVLDASSPFDHEDQHILDSLAGSRVIAVLNKSDLPLTLVLPGGCCFEYEVSIAAKSGVRIDELKRSITTCFLRDMNIDRREFVAISRSRHRDALLSAGNSLRRFTDSLDDAGLEILAIDLQDALDTLGKVTGETATDDILDLIFSSFCIGK